MTENINEVNNTEMTVGEILRTARTTGRRKRELSTVAKQLCIREEFLQALEDGNYAMIPEVVYILGFARNYAMELGLDPDEIITKIKQELGLEVAKQDCDDRQAEDDVLTCGLPNSEDSGKKSWMKDFKAFVRKNWVWLLGTLAALAVAIVMLVVFLPAGDSTEIANAPVVTEGSAEAPFVYNLAIRETFGTENSEDAEVVLQATQESWVKIEDRRGNTVFSRVLVPGDIYYVPNGEGYKATFGNAGGIDVWVEGKVLPKLGADHTRKSGISMEKSELLKSAGK